MKLFSSLRAKRALVVPVAIVAAAGSSLALLSSGAWFTDTENIGSNTFTTGTVVLGATPASSALSLAGMAPGDTVVGQIQVNNTGSLATKYILSGQVTGTLQPALTTTVKSGVTTCTAAGFGVDGTVIYSAAVVPTTKTQLSGYRTPIAASGNEKLCFKVDLAGSGTTNTYQNTTATAVYTFDGVQSVNNP